MPRLLPLLLVLISLYTSAQEILETKVDTSSLNRPLGEVLRKIEARGNYKFYFLDDWFTDIKVPKSLPNLTLGELLKQTIGDGDLSFATMHGYVIYFYKDPSKSIKLNDLISSARQVDKSIVEITIGSKQNALKQVSISGTIKNLKLEEPVVGATIEVKDEGIGMVSDANGKFLLNLSGGQHVVEINSVGFEPKVINLFSYENGSLNVALEEQAKLLDEVVISDQAIHNPKSATGLYKISLADVKKMPSFMGEVDIVKQIQVLPGVTSAGEVSSGYNVRGGAADQNLILFDGLPIFNYSHVFGFFSAFNAEAVKSASFYKGGIPAEYGGRVSSVLNIIGKEADYKTWQGGAGIGLITSNLSVGGPIQKDKSSLFVSLRSSYSDWMLKTFATQYQDIQNSSVSFYDLTTKFAQKLGANDKLTLSLYASKDNFGLPSDTTFGWQNKLGSMRYDHIISDRSSFSIMAGIGQYGYTVEDNDPVTAYNMKYNITYPTLNFDISILYPRHKLAVGSNNTFYSLKPGSIEPTNSESNINPVDLEKTQGVENSLFVSDGVEISDKLHLDLGLRVSTFASIGPGSLYTYLKDSALREDTRVDTIHVGSGKTMKRYWGLEPRLAIRYSLSNNSSIKLGFNRINQYIHLISNSVAITPIDIWQVSNSFLKPQIGNQLSLGYYQSLQDNNYEFSAEGFYKITENVLDFKDGANLVLNPAIETALIPSHGKSYGMEVTFNKTKNAFVYGLNYTYSRSFRQTSNNHPEEIINGEAYYRSNYDQPHVVNANFKLAVSRRFAITGNFNYHTGRPTTVPVSYNIIEHIPIVNYSQRNAYRVPDYHRLDLAFVLEGNHRKRKLWQGTWTMSFYNVYGRRNVYTVFYAPNSEGIQAAYKMAIIGAVIPSLSYRIKF